MTDSRVRNAPPPSSPSAMVRTVAPVRPSPEARLKFSELLRAGSEVPDAEGAGDTPRAGTDSLFPVSRGEGNTPGEDRGDEASPEDTPALPDMPGLTPGLMPAPKQTADKAPKSEKTEKADKTEKPDKGGKADRSAGGARAAATASIDPDAPGRQVVDHIAETVTEFCNEPAVANSEGWQVRMALRQDLLPDTTLNLSISPQWLRLRFDIGDPASRELVSTHQDDLARTLSETSSTPREISITFD